MGLISEYVTVALTGANMTHLESKGYEIQRYKDVRGRMRYKSGTMLRVKVQDLQQNSTVRVEYTCDNTECKQLFSIPFSSYNRKVRENGECFCNRCAILMFGIDKMKKTRLANSISFKQWCYNNLSMSNADILMEKWDYELNKCNPDEVCYKSSKRWWFKCLEHREHKSEQKYIANYVKNSSNIECKQCNVIFYTHSHLMKYLVNKQDGFDYSHGTSKKILCVCPNCQNTKLISISNLSNNGYGCTKCGDGTSYPEKFMTNLLQQLGVEYVFQLNSAHFSWCQKYKYDFFLPKLNTIIEVHGMQHYEDTFSKLSKRILKEEQHNDNMKMELAKYNGIERYIIIDARKSSVEWIEKSVQNSELATLFELKKINWQKCQEYAVSSLVKRACELWNAGKSVASITDMLRCNSESIRIYLKRGTEMGWCYYNSKEAQVYSRSVICLNTKEVFDRIVDANKKYGVSVGRYLRGYVKTAGKCLVTGEKLEWMYYSEYKKKQCGT